MASLKCVNFKWITRRKITLHKDFDLKSKPSACVIALKSRTRSTFDDALSYAPSKIRESLEKSTSELEKKI